MREQEWTEMLANKRPFYNEDLAKNKAFFMIQDIERKNKDR